MKPDALESTSVSIVITAHNYAKWLPQSIDSALAQVWPAVEIVVVDDGSTDSTPQIIADYHSSTNLRTVRLDGVGLAGACNAGIAASTGEYVVRLDADDYFDENLVLVLATYLDQHSDIDVVFSDHYTVDQGGNFRSLVRRMRLDDELVLRDRPALGAGVMYRRSAYDRAGGYDDTLRYQEDYDFWLSLLETSKIANINLPLMYYRQHGSSMSTNFGARMETRQTVKQTHVNRRVLKNEKGVGLILIDDLTLDGNNAALLPHMDTDLLHRSIETMRQSNSVNEVIVLGDGSVKRRVTDLGLKFVEAALHHTSIESFSKLYDTAYSVEVDAGFICTLSPRTPFISSAHIDELVNSQRLYGTAAAIGVCRDMSQYWYPGKDGLVPTTISASDVAQESKMVFRAVPGFAMISLDSEFFQMGAIADDLTIGHIEVSPGTSHTILDAESWAWVHYNMDRAIKKDASIHHTASK